MTPATWAHQRAPRTAVAVAAVVLAGYALSGVFVVGADERGVVTQLGRVVAADVAPGVHYHAPWPFGRAESPRARIVEGSGAGGYAGGPAAGAVERLEYLTGDRSLVEAGVGVKYEVRDAAAMLAVAGDARELVRRVAGSAVAEAVGLATLDDVLSERVAGVEEAAGARAQATLDALHSGVRLTAVRVEEPRPAGAASDACARARDAVAGRRGASAEAEAYRTRMAALARGEAAALDAAAREHGARAVSDATAEATRFGALLTEYRSDPDAVRDRLYRETMSEVLGRVQTRLVD